MSRSRDVVVLPSVAAFEGDRNTEDDPAFLVLSLMMLLCVVAFLVFYLWIRPVECWSDADCRDGQYCGLLHVKGGFSDDGTWAITNSIYVCSEDVMCPEHSSAPRGGKTTTAFQCPGGMPCAAGETCPRRPSPPSSRSQIVR